MTTATFPQHVKADARKYPVWTTVLVLFVVGLIGFRLYLPTLVKDYLNKTINKIPGYSGHVNDVGIALWRGAYSIVGLTLSKTDGAVPVPFVDMPNTDFSIAWGPLFHGNLSGKVEIDSPKINFVGGNAKKNQQLGIDKSWQEQFKEMFPLRLARLGVKDGEIHFRNFEANPPVDIYLRHIFVVANNLTNSKRLSKTLKATVDVQAVAMSDGKVTAHMDLDPLDPSPTFKMALKIEQLKLADLNSYFSHYLAVEMKTGTLDFYMEGEAVKGQFTGYAKPLLESPDLVKIKKDASLGEFFKAVGVKIVSYILKNHAKDRLATKVKITGTVDKPIPNIWSAIGSFLHNWLISAIKKGFEGSTTD